MVLGGEAADVSDMADDFGGQHGAQSRQDRERGAGRSERVTHLGFVVLDLPVQAAQVGQEIAGYVPAAGVRGGLGPEALHDGSGLVGGQPGGGAAGNEVTQDGMEPVQDAGAFVDQIVVPLGQQAKDRGLVLRLNGPQVLAEQSNLGDVQDVGWVGLAVAAGGQQASPRGQGGGTSTTSSPAAASC